MEKGRQRKEERRGDKKRKANDWKEEGELEKKGRIKEND